MSVHHPCWCCKDTVTHTIAIIETDKYPLGIGEIAVGLCFECKMAARAWLEKRREKMWKPGDGGPRRR